MAASISLARAACCSALLLTTAALAQPQPPQAPQLPQSAAGAAAPVVTAAGTGQVSTDPDRAIVRLGMTAEAPEASAAQSQVNVTMQAILSAVKALGVQERAIRTEQLTLSPVYDTGSVQSRGGRTEPRIVGYSASNVVSVELDDIARIGDVVDAGIQAGANQLQGISFHARDDAAARSAALRLAVQDARAQADAMAAALGMRVIGLRELVAADAIVQPPQPYAAARFSLEAATPIQPGQVEISARVMATFFLADGAAPAAGGGR